MAPLALSEVRPVTEPVEHRPVLPRETLDWLAPGTGDLVVDGTLGAGGHAELLLERVGPRGRVVGIDRDTLALEVARARLARFGDAFTALHGNHEDMPHLLESLGIERVDRVLLDLGLSSLQLDDAERGFSFRLDGPLDMRMDRSVGQSAADIVATLDEQDLSRILWRFGEERRARAIARAIVHERERHPILRTGQLAELVTKTLGPAARRFRIHPATRTFQALRIAVNEELQGLSTLIEKAVGLLRPGGRLCVIAFHSLEDRAVKHSFKSLADRCTCPPGLPVCGCGRTALVRILTSKPVRPSDAEIERNPRARSAKLRAAERI